jgi:hypothetical protein
MDAVSFSNRLLRILRNPYGFTDDQVREARLWAGDQVEAYWRNQEAIDDLGLAISDAGYTWTPEMRRAYEKCTTSALFWPH